MDLSAVLASYKLPEPDSSWTIPVAIGLAVIALLSLAKKLVLLAVIAALLAGGFVAYQSGAFDQWVEKGTTIKNDLNIG